MGHPTSSQRNYSGEDKRQAALPLGKGTKPGRKITHRTDSWAKTLLHISFALRH